MGTDDRRVTSAIEQTLRTQADMAVELRWARGAGRRDWYLMGCIEDYHAAVGNIRPGDLLTISLVPEFSVRGTVDDGFSTACGGLLAGIRDWLHEHRGARAVAGLWCGERDRSERLVAVVPQPDGELKLPPY